jgi:hypothetical protein
MKHFMVLIVSLIAWLPLAALNGWAIATLWAWFIVPTFGLPVITWQQSIGLGIVVAYLTYQLDMQDMRDDSEPTKDLCRRIFTGLVKPLLCVGAGWVYLKVFW